MKQVLQDIFKAIANRPPVLWAAIGGIVSSLGGQIDVLEPYKELLMLAVPPVFGAIASRFTVGPETGKELAQAALSSKPAEDDVREKAISVLTMPKLGKR